MCSSDLTNFIKDYHMSCVSIGLIRNGKRYLGVVHNPYLNETFYAISGEGAYMNGNAIHVSKDDLANSIVLFGSSPYNTAADTCHKYDKCWSCPPGCGSLEECEAKVRQYKYGIIVQTVGELEDAFDGEGMMETEARHKEYFVEFEKKLREIYPDMLAIGAGCCTKCKVCTYPDLEALNAAVKKIVDR